MPAPRPSEPAPGEPVRPEPAGPAHAAALAAVHAACFPPAERWDAEFFATQLCLPGTYAHVVPDAGFVLWRLMMDEAEILTLAVLAQARRRGVARALMLAALEGAAAGGAAAMFLEVGRGNTAARALYAGLGFESVGERRNYYADGEDALVLQRVLA